MQTYSPQAVVRFNIPTFTFLLTEIYMLAVLLLSYIPLLTNQKSRFNIGLIGHYSLMG